jgi:uncharacterized membrane-anchored protein
MKRDALSDLLAQASAQGLLPADAAMPQEESRPWPVLLLTAIGAWLSAVPLIVVVGMLLGDLASRGMGPYAVGTLLLAGTVVVLRGQGVPLFVEQLTVPALLVAGGTLGFGLFRDLPAQGAAAALGAVALAVAFAVPRPWLRTLLGAAAAALLAGAFVPSRWLSWSHGHLAFWLGWHVDLAAWLGALALQRQWQAGRQARVAAALESIATGWLLATLAGLAWWSGMTFLVGATATGLVGEVARELALSGRTGTSFHAMQALSALLAMGAAALLWRTWPTTRRLWCAAVAAPLVGLAWFMPSLGALLVALAMCAASRRPGLGGAAGLAAAWTVGSFYYALAWPLSDKAAVLVAVGAALAGLARYGWPAADPASPAAPMSTPGPSKLAPIAAVVTALATLLVVNLAIREKEALIARGQPVFVELAPVDPRSLMQGDYMRLAFRIPADARSLATLGTGSERPHVVAAIDARGVATLLRLDDGRPLEPGQLRIELTPKDGGWILVTDAWYFAEGEAQRWGLARYGEFRVDETGRALLVGLRGRDLEPL